MERNALCRPVEVVRVLDLQLLDKRRDAGVSGLVHLPNVLVLVTREKRGVGLRVIPKSMSGESNAGRFGVSSGPDYTFLRAYSRSIGRDSK